VQAKVKSSGPPKLGEEASAKRALAELEEGDIKYKSQERFSTVL